MLMELEKNWESSATLSQPSLLNLLMFDHALRCRRGENTAPLRLFCTLCLLANVSSCCLNPRFGETTGRFFCTYAMASVLVIFLVAIMYAETTVALRLMPIRQ